MRYFLFALLLVAGSAIAGSYYQCTDGECERVGIAEMPACADYNNDLPGCPGYTKATECAVYTADGVIADNAGQLISVTPTNITANDDILIYDNASAASGTVILNGLNLPAGHPGFPNHPAPFSNGAYLDLTTAGSMNVNVCHLE